MGANNFDYNCLLTIEPVGRHLKETRIEWK